MRKFSVWSGLILSVASVAALVAMADEAPKFKTKEVMAKAMKGGLCEKVAKGEANDEEKKALVEMFTALAANKPAKGDADSWKAKTTALVEAAKAAAKGDAGAGDKLKAAANCGACHMAHKG